jgi:hypothetical protein
MTQKIVTITKVKTPWDMFPFLLKKAFIKSIPEYKAKKGLEFKYYHTSDSGANFGGIYLWKDHESAANVFNDLWFEKVRKRLKCEGKVEYFSLIQEDSFVDFTFDYKSVKNAKSLLIAFKTLEELNGFDRKESGVLNAYKLKNERGYFALLLFSPSQDIAGFVKEKGLELYETFKTPVLLKNKK